MTSRVRAIMTCLPLVLALIVIAVAAAKSVSSLGRTSHSLLSESDRSALAAQRMKDELDQLARATDLAAAGLRGRTLVKESSDEKAFASDLSIQETTIREPPAAQIVTTLRREWTEYQVQLRACMTREKLAELQACVLRDLEPRLSTLSQGVSRLLEQKQEVAIQESKHLVDQFGALARWLLCGALGAIAIGLGSAWTVTSRATYPLDTLSKAIEQFGRGDLAVRAHVRGGAEARALATAFNTMADRMEQYRRSSLGEMLYAQLAAQAVLNSLPDPVFVFDLDGDILTLNPAAEKLLPNGGGAMPMLRGLDPQLRGAVDTLRWHVLQGKGSVSPTHFDEAIGLLQPDDERLFLPRAEAVHDQDGTIVAATVLLQDVTRLRRFDELRNDLLLTTAHQFRTPLTSVRMAIHLCLEGVAGALSEKQQDLLEAAREECERLHSTVNEMLDLARLQSAAIELNREEILAGDLLSRALRAYRSSAAARSVAVRVEPVWEDLSVWVDQESVWLVFSNLMENALRHTPAGGSITLRARPDAEYLRFEVEDTGPGIPRACRDRIFEKFWRGPGSDMNNTGLGLSIARNMISVHGGEIGVESAVGAGSTFWFTLPRAKHSRRVDGNGAILDRTSNI
ncbi:MAG TPA: ATP-binding protein [Myxococcota bacterium]|nr:ATP-binding protein [Myxococcota bacterium]